MTGLRVSKESFGERKKTPWRTHTILVYKPKKYSTKLHKKMAKLVRQYDKADGKPLTQARILKSALAVERRLKH